MNYIEMYKLCKEYTDFVEANMQSVQRINDVARCDTLEEFLEMHGDGHFDIDVDSMILTELVGYKNAIARPIQEEMIDAMQNLIHISDDIYNSIHTFQEKSEDTSTLEKMADKIVNDFIKNNPHLVEDVTEAEATSVDKEEDVRATLRSWRHGRK